MDQSLIRMLEVISFLVTGLAACLNAWGGRWGASFAMLGITMLLFAGGAFLAGSFLIAIPAVLFVVFIGALYVRDVFAIRGSGDLDDSQGIRHD